MLIDMTNEEKKQRRVENYYANRMKDHKYKMKKSLKEFKSKYKGWKFNFDDATISIEINLPFRCMETKWGQNNINEKEYYLIQKDLRNRLESVTKNFLAVVEPVYIQVVIKNNESLSEVCDIIYQFGKEKTQKYGIYTKNGRLLKNYFE